MSASNFEYAQMFGNINTDSESFSMPKCACVKCNSCTCACTCSKCRRSSETEDIEW